MLEQARRRYTIANYWTRARVLEGLRAFHRETGAVPTCTATYQQMTKGKAGAPRKVSGSKGWPVISAILRFFPTIVQAWHAIGVQCTPKRQADWQPHEDAILRAGYKLICSKDLMRLLPGRTRSAIQRRSSCLNQKAPVSVNYGLTLYEVCELTGLHYAMLKTLVDAGELPLTKGAKCYFVQPEDALHAPTLWLAYNAERGKLPGNLGNRCGMRHGQLTIIQYRGKEEGLGRLDHYWLAECRCGQTRLVTNNEMSNGAKTPKACRACSEKQRVQNRNHKLKPKTEEAL